MPGKSGQLVSLLRLRGVRCLHPLRVRGMFSADALAPPPPLRFRSSIDVRVFTAVACWCCIRSASREYTAFAVDASGVGRAVELLEGSAKLPDGAEENSRPATGKALPIETA